MRWTNDDHFSVVVPGPDARVVTAKELEAIDRARPSATPDPTDLA